MNAVDFFKVLRKTCKVTDACGKCKYKQVCVPQSSKISKETLEIKAKFAESVAPTPTTECEIDVIEFYEMMKKICEHDGMTCARCPCLKLCFRQPKLLNEDLIEREVSRVEAWYKMLED